jgi:hypothetical protein
MGEVVVRLIQNVNYGVVANLNYYYCLIVVGPEINWPQKESNLCYSVLFNTKRKPLQTTVR